MLWSDITHFKDPNKSPKPRQDFDSEEKKRVTCLLPLKTHRYFRCHSGEENLKKFRPTKKLVKWDESISRNFFRKYKKRFFFSWNWFIWFHGFYWHGLLEKIVQLCKRLKVPKLAQIGALWWPPYGLKVNLKTFRSCESGNICTWWILFWDLGIRLGSLKKNLNSSNCLRKTTLNQFNRMKRRSALSHKKFMHILFIW